MKVIAVIEIRIPSPTATNIKAYGGSEAGTIGNVARKRTVAESDEQERINGPTIFDSIVRRPWRRIRYVDLTYGSAETAAP